MERAYFLLTGDGPEKEAIRQIEADEKATSQAWHDFANRYAPKGMVGVPFADRQLIGVRFKPDIEDKEKVYTMAELKSFAPDGWTRVAAKYPTAFKPIRRDQRKAFEEFSSMPVKPRGDKLGDVLKAPSVVNGRRIMFVSGWELHCGEVVVSAPIDKDFTFWRPKGPSRLLTAKGFCDLMLREKGYVASLNAG